MNFRDYFQKESFEDFETQIDKLAKQNELLESSVTFLSKKIEDFKINGKLEEYEIDFIKKQIEFHKKLSILKKEYLYGIKNFTQRSKKEIDSIYKENEGTIISKSELDLIRGKTLKEKEKLIHKYINTSYRDYVEENVNINNWPESIYESEIITKFYELFTIYYLNFIEKFHSEKNIIEKHKNIKKGLIVSKSEIESILFNILKDNGTELNELNNDLIINIGGEKEKFSIKNIKNKVKTNSQTKVKNIKPKVIKKSNKDPKKSLLIKKEISKDKLLQKLEKSKSFNYLDFIDEYGLTEEIKKIYLQMVNDKMENLDVYIDGKVIRFTPEFITKNQELIINNLMVLNKIIVGIECDGINRNNDEGGGASGYFQLHTTNGSSDRTKGEFDSFETALRRSYRFLSKIDENKMPYKKLKNHKDVPSWITDTYNKNKIKPNDLSTQKQNTLFIYDMFNNGKTVFNGNGEKKSIPDYLGLVIIGNLWSAEKFYEFFHHTEPDEMTIKRIKYYTNKYRDEFKKIDQ